MSTNTRVNGAPSVSSQETQDLTSEDYPSAQEIADNFVKQYYDIIKHYPENTFMFYKDESTLSRPGSDGSMQVLKTLKEINDAIMGSDIKNWETHLLDVHAQDTLEGSVIVGVVGYLRKDNLLKFFSQTFLLALRTSGALYVHNDFFQFVDTSSPIVPIDSAVDHLVVMKDKRTSTDAINHTSNNSSCKQNSLLPDEPNKISALPLTQSVVNTTVTKVSYASIVTKGSSLPSPDANVHVFPNKNTSSRAPPVVHCVEPAPPPNNEKNTTTEATREVLKNDQENKFNSLEEVDHSKSSQVEKNSPQNAQEDANKGSYDSMVTKSNSLPIPPKASQQVLEDKRSTTIPATPRSSTTPFKPSAVPRIVKTILIKDIPPQATRRTLTHAVKAYGPVKHKNIQIRQYRDGYRYAFVEFNGPKSARLAVQAGTIKFDDWECQVEPKKAQIEGSDWICSDGVSAGSDDCSSTAGGNGDNDGSSNL